MEPETTEDLKREHSFQAGFLMATCRGVLEKLKRAKEYPSEDYLDQAIESLEATIRALGDRR